MPSRNEMSLRCLKQISIERDISTTSQKHLKRDIFFKTSLRRLKYISKKVSFLWRLWDVSNTSQKTCLFFDVFKTSQIHLKKDVFQIHLKKDVFQVTSLRHLNHISKKMFILSCLSCVSKINLESICDYSKISHKNGLVVIKSICGC